MKSVNERIIEFCKYHRDGDGECNSVVLRAWADNHNLNLEQRWELAYMFAITYNVVSAIVLYENPDEWSDAERLKSKIVFQSDRKYVRIHDRFKNCLAFYVDNLSNPKPLLDKWLSGGKFNLTEAISDIEKWYYFGRFSAFLFLEMFIWLTDIPVKNAQTIEWKHGNTATSGLLNVFGYDELANQFDSKGKLGLPIEKMDELLNKLLQAVKSSGGNANVTVVETSLCAYRKHYKGTRYNGYYLDRMLEELYALKEDYPDTVAEIFNIRKQHYSKRYLGEILGWRGIRKECKKSYLRTNKIM
jgi:hypothetical protein